MASIIPPRTGDEETGLLMGHILGTEITSSIENSYFINAGPAPNRNILTTLGKKVITLILNALNSEQVSLKSIQQNLNARITTLEEGSGGDSNWEFFPLNN